MAETQKNPSGYIAHVCCREHDAGLISESVCDGRETDVRLALAVLAVIANIVFDYVFIVLRQMGIKGAAFGTGIGYMIPTIIGTVFFLRGS